MWPSELRPPTRPRAGAIDIHGKIVIRRPVADVFEFVADERNETSYNPRMVRVEKQTPGPIGLGTRWHAETSGRRGRVPMTIEITRFEHPSRIEQTTHLAGMDIDGALVFVPVHVGTLMCWTWHLHPRGLLRLAGPLIARIGRRNERAIWSGLKHLLEEEALRVDQVPR